MAALLPVIGLIRLDSIDHANRYNYIPSVFIWFFVGLILSNVLYPNKSKANWPHSKILSSFPFRAHSKITWCFCLFSGVYSLLRKTSHMFNMQSITRREYKPDNFAKFTNLFIRKPLVQNQFLFDKMLSMTKN